MPKKKVLSKKKVKKCRDPSDGPRVFANRYKVKQQLGSGNFGTALLVEDLQVDECEKWKVLKEVDIGDLDPTETIGAVKEAQILSRLSHPGVVKFFDSFLEGDSFCLVTEYCEGGDLDNKISEMKNEGKRFTEAQILEWTIQLLLALHHMHSKGVLHRDMKSSNIFLKDNMIKIGDFGNSRILIGTVNLAHTFLGTPYYMSPEVLQHEGYNSKSDIWAVGCVMYELCALDHAFESQGLMGVMYRIVEGACPHIPEIYTQKLQDIIESVLEKDVELRPSAFDILKFPYMERHLKLYMTKLTANRPDLAQTIAKQEAQQMTQSRASESDLFKNLTPKEAMRLRKQQEAEARAKKLEEAARVEYERNQELIRKRREKMLLNSEMLPFQSHRPRPGFQLPEERKNDVFGHNKSYPLVQKSRNEVKGDECPSQAVRTVLEVADPAPFFSPESTDTFTGPAPPYHKRLYKDGPAVDPARNANIYDIRYSAIQFTEGIPPSEKFDSSKGGDARKLSASERPGEGFSDEFEETTTEEETAKEEEEEQEDKPVDPVAHLVNEMHNALRRDEEVQEPSADTGDDGTLPAIGPKSKEEKVQILKSDCIEKLGETPFLKVYAFLRQKRVVEKNMAAESSILLALQEIAPNHVGDCFLVDQLIFYEETE